MKLIFLILFYEKMEISGIHIVKCTLYIRIMQKQIEKEIWQIFGEEISSFKEKWKIGENDSYICTLIRSDSIENFITYVNRTNFSLSSKIKPSVYETNLFFNW